MEQARARDALEQYILLSKNAPPRAAAELVLQATSAAGVFVFTELMIKPSIQALKDSADYSSHWKLLEIFAWGTWKDYEAGTRSMAFPCSDIPTFPCCLT
jgi:COP9 signalosome complex subunit 7